MKALSISKSRVVLFGAALAIGLSTTAAHAQYQMERVQFTAPFSFEYGSQHMPAGRYVVSRENSQVTRIESGTKSVMALTRANSDNEPTSRGKIVFRRYGQQFFLSEVWIPGRSSHLSSIPTKAEKRLVVAMNSAAPANVELALAESPR